MEDTGRSWSRDMAPIARASLFAWISHWAVAIFVFAEDIK